MYVNISNNYIEKEKKKKHPGLIGIMGEGKTITQKAQPRDAELLGRASLHKTGKRKKKRKEDKGVGCRRIERRKNDNWEYRWINTQNEIQRQTQTQIHQRPRRPCHSTPSCVHHSFRRDQPKRTTSMGAVATPRGRK